MSIDKAVSAIVIDMRTVNSRLPMVLRALREDVGTEGIGSVYVPTESPVTGDADQCQQAVQVTDMSFESAGRVNGALVIIGG